MLIPIWTWITSNITVLGVILGATPTIWAIFQFIYNKRDEANRQQFETYHSLIKQLVEPESPNTPMRLDRQIAIIFELRNFKRYYPVTLRILKGLKTDWSKNALQPNLPRMLEELDLAIEFISHRLTRCYIGVWLCRPHKR